MPSFCCCAGTRLLISDYNAIDQVAEDSKDAIEISVNAGIDMAMVPSSYKTFSHDLRELVVEGRVPTSRIDDAVKRILRVKCAMGLLDEDHAPWAEASFRDSLGSESALVSTGRWADVRGVHLVRSERLAGAAPEAYYVLHILQRGDAGKVGVAASRVRENSPPEHV